MPDQPSVYWVKSTFSLSNGECVEFANLDDDVVGVRDSKDPGGPILRFSRREVDAFLRGAVAGEFNQFR